MSEIEHWTIKGHDAGPVQWITGSTLVIGGRPLGPDERVEVVPAALFREAVEALRLIAVFNTRDSKATGLPSLEAGIAREALEALDRLGKAEAR
jgi:hypothetical protein